MAKLYKLSPIEHAILPKELFDDNLDKLIKNETIVDDEIFILLQALRRVDRHKTYREKALKVNAIDQPPFSESFETLKVLKKEKE